MVVVLSKASFTEVSIYIAHAFHGAWAIINR